MIKCAAEDMGCVRQAEKGWNVCWWHGYGLMEKGV